MPPRLSKPTSPPHCTSPIFFRTARIFATRMSFTGLMLLLPVALSAQHTVLVVYWSETNHTAALAETIGSGASSVVGQSNVRVRRLNETSVASDLLAWASCVVIGSPTHYGNPASAVLAWVEREWEPFWTDPRFARKIGGVFTTGGGLSQGLEHVLAALQRILFSFRIRVITPDPTRDGFASYGAVAVTGTPPFNGTGVAKPFADAAFSYGAQLATQAMER